MATTMADIRSQLTAEGGLFEVTTGEVLGREMEVYKERMKSLREIPQMAAMRGDETFLVYGEAEWSFTRFVQTSFGVAHTLAGQFGIRPGDRVAVLAQNCPEWCLTFWGTVSIDAVLVGLNGWWKTDEVLYGLQDSGSRVLVADRKRFERIAGQLDEAPDLEHVFLTDATPSDFAAQAAGSGVELHDYRELTTDPTDRAPDVAIGEDDDAVIFYTSGTTGRPKGAISTHRSMIANLQNTIYTTVSGAMLASANGEESVNALAADARTVSLLTSPLFHVAGCHSGLVVALLGGLKLVMPEGRFDPEHALQLIQDHGVTIWATVPTMVWRVCEHPDRHSFDTSSVTTVAFGGSPSAGELQRKVKDTFPNVSSTSNAYGLTETSSVATVCTGLDARRKPGSVGLPVPCVEVKVEAPDGGEAPQGETGEVCIRGPILMKGYWNKPEATADTIDPDGWLHTGDIGYLDDEGYLWITDRMKDMIIRGGENIYCVEIENRLVEHANVADAAVIGVPHDELGEEVKAYVQTEPGTGLTETEVRKWVAAELADFKVPTYVEIVSDPLPRNASGKLLKNVLRGSGDVSLDETL
jgi:long-chain acyl-CoA synthetase